MIGSESLYTEMTKQYLASRTTDNLESYAPYGCFKALCLWSAFFLNVGVVKSLADLGKGKSIAEVERNFGDTMAIGLGIAVPLAYGIFINPAGSISKNDVMNSLKAALLLSLFSKLSPVSVFGILKGAVNTFDNAVFSAVDAFKLVASNAYTAMGKSVSTFADMAYGLANKAVAGIGNSTHTTDQASFAVTNNSTVTGFHDMNISKSSSNFQELRCGQMDVGLNGSHDVYGNQTSSYEGAWGTSGFDFEV